MYLGFVNGIHYPRPARRALNFDGKAIQLYLDIAAA